MSDPLAGTMDSSAGVTAGITSNTVPQDRRSSVHPCPPRQVTASRLTRHARAAAECAACACGSHVRTETGAAGRTLVDPAILPARCNSPAYSSSVLCHQSPSGVTGGSFPAGSAAPPLRSRSVAGRTRRRACDDCRTSLSEPRSSRRWSPTSNVITSLSPQRRRERTRTFRAAHERRDRDGT